MDTPEASRGGYQRILGVLFHLTKLVNEGVPLNELLKAVAHAAVDLVGADSCSIMLLDEARAELLSKAAAGLSAEEEEQISFKVGEGIAGWVAERGAPALVPDAQGDQRFKPIPGQKLQIASLLSVPLSTRDGVIGVMTVTSHRKEAFAPEDVELLTYLASAVVKDIENARLYRLSITDSLTKAYNRQYLYQRLPDEIERCRRYGGAFSVVLFDVDHFKQLNDTYGHPAGDCVLTELVRLVHLMVREVDGLVRYGGEEFLLLMPKTDLRGAAEVAERIRASVEDAAFAWADQTLKITVSLGIAALHGGPDTDEHLLKRADDALYQAKSAGRNQVRIA